MFLQLLKSKSKEENELSRLFDHIRESQVIDVVGRGTVVIEPETIFDSPEFKKALERAASIVKR